MVLIGEELPIYAPFEVVIHNTPYDFWVSFLGKVYNLTPLIVSNHDNDDIKPILPFAGKDISHWFDAVTEDLQTYIHPVTGVRVPYCPHGKFLDVSYEAPTPLWKPVDAIPWWKNPNYQIGVLTKKVRPIRIVNMLIGKEVTLNVCEEDIFWRICERYSPFNSKAYKYVWVYRDKRIDMDKTMDENGIVDERDKMARLGIPRLFYSPQVRIYYQDDLQVFEEFKDDEDSDSVLPIICCDCKYKKDKRTNLLKF